MLIKLVDYDPEKHVKQWYETNRGTHIDSPTLAKDIKKEGNYWRMPMSTLEQLQHALKENPKAKAHFAIHSGSKGGFGSRWYFLKNVRVEVDIKR